MATSPSTPESSSTSSHRSLPLAMTSIHQFTTPITLKLDEDNYLLWKHQVLASIRGLKLSHFLAGTNVLSTTASSAADSSSPSDDSLRYQQQDQLIIAWLLASMSTPILTNVVGLDTTADIWRYLETQFSSHTRAKVQKLKLQLKTLKNDRSISSYLYDIKNAVNMLAAIGAPVSIADHIDIILEGLPEEYNAFITAVTSRTDPYTITEIEALLFAQEDRFTRYKTSHSSFLQVNTASVVSPNHSKFHPRFPTLSVVVVAHLLHTTPIVFIVENLGLHNTLLGTPIPRHGNATLCAVKYAPNLVILQLIVGTGLIVQHHHPSPQTPLLSLHLNMMNPLPLFLVHHPLWMIRYGIQIAVLLTISQTIILCSLINNPIKAMQTSN